MKSVGGIILQRLALGLLTLLVVSVVIFVAVNLLPGDFAEAILGTGRDTGSCRDDPRETWASINRLVYALLPMAGVRAW